MSPQKGSSEGPSGSPKAEPPEPFPFRELTDPRAIRALAHPVRMALLELLAHLGTMTATQASEVLGESPANCAFHLRTLAKYGFVEEAGGGRGRERPWRRSHSGLSMDSEQGSPELRIAVRELEDLLTEEIYRRARTSLAERASWPDGWRSELGASQAILYLTLAEARELQQDLRDLLTRFVDRIDHPEHRPAGALPIEMLTLAHPLLHLPPASEEN